MGICLTYHVNCKMSTRQTAHVLEEVKGIKHYVWIVMDACKKSILGYQVSDTRSTGPCILAMRMAFDKFKYFPGKALNFVAGGYSAYPLAKQQFKL